MCSSLKNIYIYVSKYRLYIYIYTDLCASLNFM